MIPHCPSKDVPTQPGTGVHYGSSGLGAERSTLGRHLLPTFWGLGPYCPLTFPCFLHTRSLHHTPPLPITHMHIPFQKQACEGDRPGWWHSSWVALGALCQLRSVELHVQVYILQSTITRHIWHLMWSSLGTNFLRLADVEKTEQSKGPKVRCLDEPSLEQTFNSMCTWSSCWMMNPQYNQIVITMFLLF